MGSVTLAFCLVPIASAPPAAAPSVEEVSFRGRVHAVGELPAEVDERLRAAVQRWGGWAAAHGYRMAIDDELRVLVLSFESERRFEKTLELVRDTSLAFDELLPAPARSADEQPVVVDWGSGIPLPDRDPIVLVRLESPADLDALLGHMK